MRQGRLYAEHGWSDGGARRGEDGHDRVSLRKYLKAQRDATRLADIALAATIIYSIIIIYRKMRGPMMGRLHIQKYVHLRDNLELELELETSS